MPKIIDDPVIQILDYARKLLSEEGYSALNMRAIANHCGIATGTIYNYFDNKDTLLMRLMMDFWEELFLVMDEIDHSKDTFYKKLDDFYLAFSDFTRRFHDVFIIPNKGKGMSQSSRMASTSTNKRDFMTKLNQRLSLLIDHTDLVLPTALTTDALAQHILANFIAIPFTEGYSYEDFIKILKLSLRP